MTGNRGVATAVAAPTMEQRIGNGATLLGGGLTVLMCRCGVAAASLRRLTGRGDGFVRQHKAVLLHLCSTSNLCDCLSGSPRLATVRSAHFRIDVDRRSILRPRTTSRLENARKCAASARKDTLAISKREPHCSAIVPNKGLRNKLFTFRTCSTCTPAAACQKG